MTVSAPRKPRRPTLRVLVRGMNRVTHFAVAFALVVSLLALVAWPERHYLCQECGVVRMLELDRHLSTGFDARRTLRDDVDGIVLEGDFLLPRGVRSPGSLVLPSACDNPIRNASVYVIQDLVNGPPVWKFAPWPSVGKFAPQ